MNPTTQHLNIRERYGKVASNSSCCGSAKAQQASQAIGYTDQQLEVIPEDANLGLGCGNPTAIAALKPGETVLDLGSGAGIDAFLAAQAVTPSGRVIQRGVSSPQAWWTHRCQRHLSERSVTCGDNRIECRDCCVHRGRIVSR